MSDTTYRQNAVVGFDPRSLKPMLALAMTPSAPSTPSTEQRCALQAFVACGCDVLAPTTTYLACNLDVSQTLLSNSVCCSLGVPWQHAGG